MRQRLIMPPIDVINDRISYDEETGIALFKFRQGFGQWNSKYAGKVAGKPIQDGYIGLGIKGIKYKFHRVAYFIVTGIDPLNLEIDHINGNPSDNRFINLRVATPSENSSNQKMRKQNTSGIKGVSWCANASKWRAQIQYKKEYFHLGVFSDIEDAENAVENYRKFLHLEFANDGCGCLILRADQNE